MSENHEVQLSAGPVEYRDTGGTGPVIVFLHGVTINNTVWRHVIAGLGDDYRCVAPTFPFGGHRKPMKPDADLTLRGLALLVEEFLERLDLRDVTLVLNDWGGGQLLVAEGRTERIGSLVLAACEAFDNYPPGVSGKAIAFASRIPGGLWLAMQGLRLRTLRNAPGSWGWMAKRPVPDEVITDWFEPATKQRAIRRDLIKYASSIPSKQALLELAERMRGFDRPVLVAWATEDKLMPREHGRRLAGLFPNATLAEIGDSYTLIPEDRPDELTRLIREFVPSVRRTPG